MRRLVAQVAIATLTWWVLSNPYFKNIKERKQPTEVTQLVGSELILAPGSGVCSAWPRSVYRNH